mmetsp:Transcript_31174/g.72005  ORF Transcript_31174/g.72005 Transcript_31174/m.72005 type:complete len:584 (+) Transcript_31174:36-1787(+)
MPTPVPPESAPPGPVLPKELPDRVSEVLQVQHEELLARLDTWFERVNETIDRRPEGESGLDMRDQLSSGTSQPMSSSGHASPSGLPSLPQKLTPQLMRGKSIRVKEAGDEGLDSYDLARRQGSKVDMLKKMKSEEASLARSEEQNHLSQCGRVQRCCARIVKSHICEVFFALMIVSNSVYLGVQLEWSSQNRDRTAERQSTFQVINIIYAVIFLLEVCLRLVASGPTIYFCNPGWAWNWLDVFVVCSTWFELLVGFFDDGGSDGGGISNSNLRLLRVIKVTRLARVLRVLRVVQYVRPLRTLMHCLIDTTKSFVWSLLLLLLMMYVFGLLFTDAAIDHIRAAEANAVDTNLEVYFGTVYHSITTLFRSISNGMDWSLAAESLDSVGSFWVQLFNFYIAFIAFAVLNVMTGVFCNSAIKAAERDHEMVIHSLLQSRKEFKDLVSSLFHRMDDLGLGMITISEFEKHFNDEAVRAFFESLEMGAIDAWTLFASLDADGDNVISLRDFTERCIQLHGPARSVDLYAVTQQNVKLRQHLQAIEDLQLQLDRNVRSLRRQTARQDQDTHKVETEFVEFRETRGKHCQV